jgi:hypothetical protein
MPLTENTLGRSNGLDARWKVLCARRNILYERLYPKMSDGRPPNCDTLEMFFQMVAVEEEMDSICAAWLRPDEDRKRLPFV